MNPRVAIVLILVLGVLIALGVSLWAGRSGESKRSLRKERDQLKQQVTEVRQLAWDSRGTDPLFSDMILDKTKGKDQK